MSTTRRPRTRWVLLFLFVLLPLAELFVVIQVGQEIGAWWTIALLVLGSVVGSSLIRHAGARAWGALRTAVATGQVPGREVSDQALVLIGGALIVFPGFLTDALGVLLVLPFTRPLFRRLVSGLVGSQLVVISTATQRRPGPGSEGSVVRGEVVDDD
ncbi:FxsA family protein [Nocardioides sp. dk4132]|uniref:FxsA family protein n=1 Tax=unclassified Nocardioides TaxID=2615069 RepID=UPI0012965101|nr:MULTISPECIES: FxsA family protein [unclassified Nocardioides]MQW75184.1 FxsA family protein [Nocardioides sp. dk4132]QGA07660.1 FxsA family protein [Nocardioides sp. dk884]